MKLKHFGLLTLASMAMIACNNENEGFIGEQDNSPKKVVLKLEGISSGNSRSTDANTSDNKVSLNDVAIFLYDEGGYIYETKEIASASTAEWNNLTSGIEFTDVDPAVDHVVVIGNYANLKTNENMGDASAWEGKMASDLLSKQLTLKSQNQAGTENPYGGTASSTTSTKANMTLFGKGELEQVAATETVQEYEAEVQIKPIISRLEVKKVSCTFVDPDGAGAIVKPSKVTIAGIGLFDYYNTMTLDGTVLNNLMDATKILEPGTASASDGKYVFLGNAADWTWAFDKTDTDYNNELSDVSSTGAAQEMTTKVGSKSATFAYNFFPVASGTKIGSAPSTSTQQVLANVRLSVTVNDEADKEYVVTTSFKNAETGGSIVTPAPGKIYQFDYAFETDNIREDWEKDLIKVTVKVTVSDWVIEQVYPEF